MCTPGIFVKNYQPLADIEMVAGSQVALPDRSDMIRLTRLNNQPLAVNADLIKFVEQAPDTVLTLVTGEKLVVRETAHEVLERILEFRRSILADCASQAPTDLSKHSPETESNR